MVTRSALRRNKFSLGPQAKPRKQNKKSAASLSVAPVVKAVFFAILVCFFFHELPFWFLLFLIGIFFFILPYWNFIGDF